MELNTITCMDTLQFLQSLPDASVHCVVTSPAYFRLRSYLPDDSPDKALEMGMEDTPQAFVTRLVELFREARRVLRNDGTCWVNLGDTYGRGTRGDQAIETLAPHIPHPKSPVYPTKSLMMIPARFAIAMSDDGWILRSEIVWHKKNPMPESVKDRPTKAHEMIYMFAKSERYFYDQNAIREKHLWGDKDKRADGKRHELNGKSKTGQYATNAVMFHPLGRNIRDVWYLASEPQKNPHYASYPSKLIEAPIKAGCPVGGVVLDPFMGSGTTALVARRLGRNYIGADLNPAYVALANERLAQSDPYQDRALPDGSKQLSLFAARDE